MSCDNDDSWVFALVFLLFLISCSLFRRPPQLGASLVLHSLHQRHDIGASRSKHYALLEDIGVYGERDVVHCIGCGKSGHENQRWGEVVLFNNTQWGLV